MNNKYYIYIHCSNDIPFYVGKGCGDRVKNKHLTERSSEWHAAAKDNYTSDIIAYGTSKQMLKLERSTIKRLATLGFPLVNKLNNPNWTVTEETRAKLSKAFNDTIRTMPNRLGCKHTEKTKRKISKAKKGKTLSAEHVAKVSKALKGRALRLGIKHTDETKAKMSKAHKGFKHSDESKAKMSKSQKGKFVSEKARANMRAGHANIPEEVKAKRREALKDKHINEMEAQIKLARKAGDQITRRQIQRKLYWVKKARQEQLQQAA